MNETFKTPEQVERDMIYNPEDPSEYNDQAGWGEYVSSKKFKANKRLAWISRNYMVNDKP